MALDDILAAITRETDQKIADAKALHKKRLDSLKEAHEKRLLHKKQEIDRQYREKKAQMHAKADTHIALERRNAILRKKKELLDAAYDRVIESLAKKKPVEMEKLFERCLQSIGEKGVIHPSKHHAELLKKLTDGKRFEIGKPIDAAGGFLFVSDTREMDFTLEHLVRRYLRPRTEIELSRTLFS